MNMKTKLTMLQGMTGVLMISGMAVATYACVFGVMGLQTSAWLASLLGLALTLVAAGGCGAALISFFGLCERIKRGRSFEARNERALRVIAIGCGAAGVSCGVGPWAVMLPLRALRARITTLPDIWNIDINGAEAFCLPYLWAIAIAFVLLSVGLIAWALYLLMRRAGDAKRENDLTV